MTRIVAGAREGPAARASRPDGTRPTSDRAREALFNTLRRAARPRRGARARPVRRLRRGRAGGAVARRAAAVLVESDRARAARSCAATSTTVGLPGAQVVARPVDGVSSPTGPDEPFDLVFADPPYAFARRRSSARVLAALAEPPAGWPGRVVVVERSARGAEPRLARRTSHSSQQRRYGEGMLWYGRRR